MKRNFLLVMVFYYIFIIFSFSVQPAAESAVESAGIVELIYEILFTKINILPTVTKVDFITLTEPIIRKLAHFGNFFILAVLTSLYVICYKKKLLLSSFFVVVLCLAVAVSDELLQLFSEGRACRWMDVVIDISGAALGNFIFNLPGAFFRCRRKIV